MARLSAGGPFRLGRPRRKVIVVRRQSPNWRDVGPAYWDDLAAFEKMLDYEPDSVRRLIHGWDETLDTSFFEFRAQMADIACANFRRLRGARVITLQTYREGIDPEAIYAFTDDDDWFAPAIAKVLGGLQLKGDGVVWRSVRYDGEVQVRPLDGYCHTNNYALLGSTLARDAATAAIGEQHFTVVDCIDAGKLSLDLVDIRLSVTNKHPASTLMLRRANSLWGADGARQMVAAAQLKAQARPDYAAAGVPWARREARRAKRAVLAIRSSGLDALAPVTS